MMLLVMHEIKTVSMLEPPKGDYRRVHLHYPKLHLIRQVGVRADHSPVGRQVTLDSPFNLKMKILHEYCTMLPTCGVAGEVTYSKLPLRGAVGLGQSISGRKKVATQNPLQLCNV